MVPMSSPRRRFMRLAKSTSGVTLPRLSLNSLARCLISPYANSNRPIRSRPRQHGPASTKPYWRPIRLERRPLGARTKKTRSLNGSSAYLLTIETCGSKLELLCTGRGGVLEPVKYGMRGRNHQASLILQASRKPGSRSHAPILVLRSRWGRSVIWLVCTGISLLLMTR